ncbi:MAG TPA: hypothetical protein VF591_27855 [Pyrinomonadaceae bacterium]|jgi:hypothetical protein
MLIIIVLIFVILVALTYALHSIVGPVGTGYILSGLGLVISITFYLHPAGEWVQKLQEKFDRFLIKKSAFGGLTGRLKSLSSAALTYFDLSLLLLTLMFLCLSLFNSFVDSVLDMRAKGLVTFPEGGEGLTHLQLEAAGYIFLSAFTVALGLYGFNKGRRLRKIFFLRLLASVTFGLILTVVPVSLYRGEWTGLENLEKVEEANMAAVPASAEYANPFIIFGLFIFFVFALSAYVAFFSFLGKKVGAILYRAEERRLEDTNRPSADQASAGRT